MSASCSPSAGASKVLPPEAFKRSRLGQLHCGGGAYRYPLAPATLPVQCQLVGRWGIQTPDVTYLGGVDNHMPLRGCVSRGLSLEGQMRSTAAAADSQWVFQTPADVKLSLSGVIDSMQVATENGAVHCFQQWFNRPTRQRAMFVYTA